VPKALYSKKLLKEVPLNADLVNPFLTATIELFEVTFGLTPRVGEVYLDERARTHRWDISAIMVLTGSAIGVVAVRLTRLLADKLLHKSGVAWKTEEERLSLCDGMVGELVNVIAGNASGNLSGYDVEISVPIVIQGENHTVSWPDRAPILSIPFSTELGPFIVNVSLIEIPMAYRKK
jgi:chemotaxis protein CheX